VAAKQHWLLNAGGGGTSLTGNDLAGMSAELKRNMRARIDQCRRLAKYVNDPRTTEALLKMAEEGEADLARLEAEKMAGGD
jgi:hypothetical protein